MRSLCGLIVVIIIGVKASVAFADPPLKDNLLGNMEGNVKENIAYGGSGRAHELDPNAGGVEVVPQSYRVLRGVPFRAQGNVGPLPGNGEEIEALANISKSQGFAPHNIYAPMAGFADIMNSKVYFELATNTLPGPLTLYRTAMGLVEPTIELGHHHASLETSAHLTNRYMAEWLLFVNASADADPEMRQMKIANYTNCVANKIRERGTATNPSTSNQDDAGWIAAQSRCMADRIEDIKKYSNSAGNFDSIDTMTEPGYDFWYHPDNNSYFSGLGVSSGNDDRSEIYLTSLLFNSTNIRSGQTIDKIKRDFQTIYGDYKFTIDKTNSAGGTGGGRATRTASRDLRYERIPPTKHINDLMKEAHRENFKTIMEMVIARCKEHVRPADLHTDSFTRKPFCRADGNPALTVEKMVSASAIGYQMDCAMVDMLVHRFDIASAVQNRSSQNICDLETDPSKIPTGTVTGTGGAAGTPPNQTNDAPIQTREGYRAADVLARNVSVAQIMGVASQTKQIVDTVAGSSGLDHLKLKFANQLIVDQIGYVEPEAALDAVVSAINDEFLPELIEETSKKTGRGGKKIVPVIKDSRPMGSAASGLNGSGGSGQ